MRAPIREEQEKVEELWRSSARSYGQARRRENCALWAQHHQRLARGFYAHAEDHAREQERYQRLLAEEA